MRYEMTWLERDRLPLLAALPKCLGVRLCFHLLRQQDGAARWKGWSARLFRSAGLVIALSALKGVVNFCQRRLVNEVLGPLITELVPNFGREGATPIQRGSSAGLLGRV